jgi:hypothetical protein
MDDLIDLGRMSTETRGRAGWFVEGIDCRPGGTTYCP